MTARGGTPQRAITIENHAVRSLCWSANGELIAAADQGGTELHQLYVRHPDGPTLPLSTDPAGRVQRLLSWNAASPDGALVAFSSNARASTDMDVVIADLATRTERPLVTGAFWHVVGGWSPDGARLLVMRVFDTTTHDLLVVDPRNVEAREITRHAEDSSHLPAGWLADGRAVVITDEGSDHLWLGALDIANGTYEAIDRPDWDVELAASSADGRTQIWSVNDDGYSTLRWRVGSGPSRERRLDGAACEDLVISADGSRAAFTRLSPIEPWEGWTLDPATGAARMALGCTCALPEGGPGEPDGTRLPSPQAR